MASRKEEREQLRAERERRQSEQRSQDRKRLILGYAVAGVLTAAVVIGIVVVAIGGDDDGDGGGRGDSSAAGIDHQSGVLDGKKVDDRDGSDPPAQEEADLAAAVQGPNCTLRENLEDEGNNHIAEDADLPKFATTPPTSGDHTEPPQADGAYAEPLNPLRYLHSMEHGRIVIHYSPDLPEEDQLVLKGLFSEDPEGMLLAPNPDMPFEVAATAWTQLVGCKSFEDGATVDVLRAFRDTWRGRGPEAIPL